MELRACGYYILVEIEQKEEIQDSLIFIPEEYAKNDIYSSDIGIVCDIGPTVFSGMEALERFVDAKERAEKWGFRVGDKVEFTRYDGKQPTAEGYENHRFIQDQHVIGRIDNE